MNATMTYKRKTHDGYYVTAIIDGGTANQRTSYLVGPFTGNRAHMAALAMVEPARKATHDVADPRFAFAAFGTTKLTMPVDKPLPAGRLDLSLIRLDHVIYSSIPIRARI